ncbi:hypothetical protein ElyMa_005812500 [Elysia marginata]|uniref:Uncharacterized protein n=1 Tax=Elysia marginata TaxID=1093978 RepID=A0AAV4FUH1_9GAST|nr:hypothetical protein ElyMa_005812500 [Elysia marginata]
MAEDFHPSHHYHSTHTLDLDVPPDSRLFTLPLFPRLARKCKLTTVYPWPTYEVPEALGESINVHYSSQARESDNMVNREIAWSSRLPRLTWKV